MKLSVTVDLNVIRNNLYRIRESTGREILLMVKADGYRHGMTEVAEATSDIVAMFGVATVEEGAELRAAGIEKGILTAICTPSELPRAAECGLTVAVADDGLLDALAEYAKTHTPPDFHVKLDTGMHRLGFDCSRAKEIVARLKAEGLRPSGCYSHMRSADSGQAAVFGEAAEIFSAAFPEAVMHLASSSSVSDERNLFDMVRIGHAAYDGAMRVTSRVIASRRVKRGECVGYGNNRVDKDCNIAVVFGGYFDGVRRESPSSVIIRGRKCATVGTVCMDMFAVDTGDFLAEDGEEAVLQGAEITAREVADQRNTIDYTVMTGWHGRTERIYVYDESGSQKTCEIAYCEDE